MRPVNIYTLTRVTNPSRMEKLERQMSKRSRILRVREWETEGLRAFCMRLGGVMEKAYSLKFYYSFTMPKLGKEFDLLRIDESSVVNVELKSGNVTDETIRRQLVQNRYYLSTLGKAMYFYTYVSGSDRLVRLSNSGRLVEAAWEELAVVLEKQKNCYDGSVEDLFKEDKFLISPLTDPGRFLRKEYFLTSQQKDIKKQILKRLEGPKTFPVQGFTGLPGTGKTLLLYDIAMQLSMEKSVCVFHFGSHEKELEQLDERLKRVDFYYCESGEKPNLRRSYSAILIDEGHWIDAGYLDMVLALAEEWEAPVIFSYDTEDMIAGEEKKRTGAELIEKIPEYISYRLTNRIRLNGEISSFIGCVMHTGRGNHRQDYPSVDLAYAGKEEELREILRIYEEDGYTYIRDMAVDCVGLLSMHEGEETLEIGTFEASCREFDKVVMLVDASFVYDGGGYLRSTGRKDFRVRNLFHGLSRAKKKIALIVYENEAVFDALLSIIQR